MLDFFYVDIGKLTLAPAWSRQAQNFAKQQQQQCSCRGIA